MKNFFINILIVLNLIFSNLDIQASHVTGGNITYQCLGTNQYLITLTIYEDCGSAFEGNGTQTIQINNSCGIGTTINLSLQNTIYQEDISQICSSQLNLTECYGGILPGAYLHQWEGVVTLPGSCNNWIFSYSSCCRNTSSNLTAGSSQNYYWETTLNNSISDCNNSPKLNSRPIPFVCLNQPVFYNIETIENDGDSLHYSFISAKTSATGTVPYVIGLSGTNPINGITINSNNGEINFTPTMIGNFTIVVLIEEFDENNSFIGSVLHDFQFEVINCPSNTEPQPVSLGISNFIGNGILINSTEIQACYGDSFCFDIQFSDSSNDSIILTSNLSNLFSNATFIQNNFIGGIVSATICVDITSYMNSTKTIIIKASDNNCPIIGINSFSVNIHTLPKVYLGNDLSICLGSEAQLNESGGSLFTWELITGDTITPSNFSCINCGNPIVSPTITSTYKVISNLVSVCNNSDTLTVFVTDDYSYQLFQSDTITCINGTILTDIIPNVINSYTYSWSPSDFLSSSFVSNPTITPLISGLLEYLVTIDNLLGCVKTDTLFINVLTTPNVIVTPSTSIICEGEEITLIASGADTYIWNTSDSTAVIEVSPTNLTVYSVVGQNGSCESDQTLVTVQVSSVPNVIANSNLTNIPIGGAINFNNFGSNASSYSWNFGDGQTSTQGVVSHTYNVAGTYNVVLTGTIGGCTATSTLTILVGVSSIDQVSLEESVNLHPNPSNGQFTLKIDMNDAQVIDVELYNAIGQIITTKSINHTNSSVVNFDVTNQSNGFYFVKIKTKNGTVTKRVSVSK